MIEPTTKLLRNRDLVSTEVDGETVMLDVDSGHYFALTGVGTHIWSSLEETRSVDAIVDDVTDSFTVADEDKTRAEIVEFLQKMVDRGLVEVKSA